MRILLCGVALFVASPAFAQTSYVNPNAIGGGYTITRPGGPTTYVNPNAIGGGYTATTPGVGTSFVRPNAIGGGYTINTINTPRR
jgi:hypothetical protein